MTLSVCSETRCTVSCRHRQINMTEKSLDCKGISRPRCHGGSHSAKNIEACAIRRIDPHLLHKPRKCQSNSIILFSISRNILQRGRAILTTLGLQPITNRYFIYRMPQDRINIRVYFVGKIWRRMFQQFLYNNCGYTVLSKYRTKGLS